VSGPDFGIVVDLTEPPELIFVTGYLLKEHFDRCTAYSHFQRKSYNCFKWGKIYRV